MLAIAHRPIGRPRGITLARVQKQYVIAGGVIMGLKIADIARQVGVSRSWASREANSPAVRNIIGELIWSDREKIKELLMRSADAIEDALDARNHYVRKGRILHGGPDHYTRLDAIDALVNWLEVMS